MIAPIDALRAVDRYQQSVSAIDGGIRTRQLDPATIHRNKPQPPPVAGESFSEVLRKRVDLDNRPVEFSRHAIDRIAERAIPFGTQQLQRLSEGIDRAQAKGSQTAAVMVDDVAMVVAVNNRTVITAVPVNQLKEGVLTQIDSVLFV